PTKLYDEGVLESLLFLTPQPPTSGPDPPPRQCQFHPRIKSVT
ncbi:unnamed protein product, partial [Gulo gulo]